MADEDGVIDGQETENEEVVHQNGESRIKALEEKVVLTQILADPDIRRVLESKRQGKPVQFVEEKEEEPVETEEETVDLDELSGGDEQVKKTLETISSLIDKKLGKGMSALEKMSERLAAVESVAGDVQKKEVKTQVSEAKKKYKDFDEHGEAILKLSQQLEGLSVEELYLMAKHRAGKLKLDQPSTFTEKPTTTRRGEPALKKKNEPLRRGRKAFSEGLRAALEKLELE